MEGAALIDGTKGVGVGVGVEGRRAEGQGLAYVLGDHGCLVYDLGVGNAPTCWGESPLELYVHTHIAPTLVLNDAVVLRVAANKGDRQVPSFLDAPKWADSL